MDHNNHDSKTNLDHYLQIDPLNTEWELYNIEEDQTQSVNLADQYLEKTKELEDVFMKEAERYDVFPLGGSLRSSLQPESNL